MIAWPAKKPGEVLDYGWPVPLDEGDSVASFTVERLSGTVTLSDEAQNDGRVSVTVTGGAPLERAVVQITAITAAGRTFIETFSLFIGVEKLTIDTLKTWLRYEPEDGEQDLTLSISLNAAIGWVERNTGLLLTRREVTQPVREFGGCIEALYGPNPEVTTITYVGSGDTPATIDDARVERTDTNGRGAFHPAFGSSWPWGRSINVVYQAGYSDPNEVPELLLMAALVMTGYFDRNRAGGADKEEILSAAWMIIDPLRLPGIA